MLVRFTTKIEELFSLDPIASAQHLFQDGFIDKDVLDKTLELNEIKTKKAARLYTTVLGVVKDHPHKVDDFVSMLPTSQGFHKELIQELKSALKQ